MDPISAPEDDHHEHRKNMQKLNLEGALQDFSSQEPSFMPS
jgi:hypothetical protein